jgi:hypothetical protein
MRMFGEKFLVEIKKYLSRRGNNPSCRKVSRAINSADFEKNLFTFVSRIGLIGI